MSSPSLREIGNEQAAEGTTIDGNRLSRMLKNLARRWNAVPPRNIKRRWMPVTYSGGFTPREILSGVQDSLPWMGAYNSNKQLVGAVDPDGYQNFYRSKGNVVSGINPEDLALPSVDDLLTWTTAFYARKPTRITGLFVGMIVDANYPNDFQYGPTPPDGKASLDSVDDWSVVIEVDNPYSREDRSASSLVYVRAGNVASAWQWSNVQPEVPGTDMQPAHPGGHLGSVNSWNSLFLVDQNINIEVPRDSRIRLHITIPKYETDALRGDYAQAGWNSNGTINEVWQQQTYSWSLHLAEALV